MNDVILRFHHISKSFPGVVALDDVSMEFRAGEVHAIIGENGAGKSTLIKILTGAHMPTKGTIELFGKEYNGLTPIQAMELGVSAVYQEFNLVPFLTVSENIFFGREKNKGIFLDKKAMYEETARYAHEMGMSIDPNAQVRRLGVAYQQIVEILKAMSQNAKILIMDEPSAPLTNNETAVMFEMIKKLKQKNVTILYISHRLEEIFEICDRVTIMRDGKHIRTTEIENITRERMIADMVGRELGENFPGGAGSMEETVLEAEHLTTHAIKDVSFTLKKGEILGLGGLVGAGRTELARAIFGADPILSGTVTLNGKALHLKSPRDAIANKIGLVPEDRKGQGLILEMSVGENITHSILDRLCTVGLLNAIREKQVWEKMKKELLIKTPSFRQLVKNLSGGNQQKVVIAKWRAVNCQVLILDEPTRGIDVGAKQEIYGLMQQLTKEGVSIIMISSEMPELIGMSDRILIMSGGSVKGELYKSEFSQEKILDIASN